MYVRPGGMRARGTRSLVPDWAPAAGEIKAISLNTRTSINPKNDPAANPNYPSTPPWDVIGGTQWQHVTDYCGALYAPDLLGGTYIQYASAGHSAGGPCMWIGFPLSTRQWQRVGRQPLPSDSFKTAEANPSDVGAYYPAGQLDATWGEWQGSYSGWGAFAQSGYNPPEGSHTRNSMVVRPPSKAGNTSGQIITCWQPTGISTGTGIRGSFVYDIDTGLFSRTANLRPDAGNAVGGVCYFESLDCVVGLNMVSSGYVSSVDVLDCSTMTWVRRTVSGAPTVDYDSTCFQYGNYYVLVAHKLAGGSPPFTLWAVDASLLKAGTSTSWTQLTVSAASYPVNGGGVTCTVGWAYCSENDSLYAVNRVHGSNKLWKLAPPADTLAGTWAITEQTMTTGTLDARLESGSSGTSFDYRRLHWHPGSRSLLWTGDYMSGDVQAIRPTDIV